MRVLLEEYTRDEARSIAHDSLVVLPVGATEQHGPHLPVYTDTLLVTHIARAAAAEAAAIPVLVAPTLPFGSSHHHLPFGGTLSIATDTYYRLVCDLVESLVKGGFQRIFLLNGHGGNTELLELVARDMAQQHRANLATAPYWTIGWRALVEQRAHADAWLPGHAGIFETSMMLAIHPELVRDSRPERGVTGSSDPRGWDSPFRTELHGSWQRIDGFTDNPARATAERGTRYLQAITASVAQAFATFYAEPTP